jgi:hypothetical protein
MRRHGQRGRTADYVELQSCLEMMRDAAAARRPVKAGRVFRGHPKGLALIGPSTVACLIGSGLEALAK